MDADLQHDETQLPKMLGLLQSGQAELVVGSRYVSGGDTGSFGSARLGGSVLATNIAKKLLHVEIADPMSGFFMIRRERFEQLAPSLSVQGFKILLDIVGDRRRKTPRGRGTVFIRRTAARREQTGFAGRAGLPWPSCLPS